MERTIKFRGIKLDTKEWVYGYFVGVNKQNNSKRIN